MDIRKDSPLLFYDSSYSILYNIKTKNKLPPPFTLPPSTRRQGSSLNEKGTACSRGKSCGLRERLYASTAATQAANASALAASSRIRLRAIWAGLSGWRPSPSSGFSTTVPQ